MQLRIVRALKKISLACCMMIMITIGVNLNRFTETILHSVQVDRQLYGQFRRWLVRAPKMDFKNKYETPYFRQFNLNTKSDRLGLCSWLKGKKLSKYG